MGIQDVQARTLRELFEYVPNNFPGTNAAETNRASIVRASVRDARHGSFFVNTLVMFDTVRAGGFPTTQLQSWLPAKQAVREPGGSALMGRPPRPESATGGIVRSVAKRGLPKEA